MTTSVPQGGFRRTFAGLLETRAGLQTGIACAVASAVGVITIQRLVWAFFLKPVTQEFHWARSTYVGMAAVIALIGALLAVPVGRFVDRYGPRAVIVPGMALFGLALMAQALLNGSKLELFALWTLVGLAAVTQSPIAIVKAISGWFHESRGLALALFPSMGTAVGSTVLPILIVAVVSHYGWRAGFVSMGALPIIIAFPVMLFWFRNPEVPRASLREPLPIASDSDSPAVRQALKSRLFWMIFAATTLNHLVITGVATSAVAMFSDKGFPAVEAAGYVSVMGLCTIIGRFVAGVALDRFDTPKVGLPFYMAATLGVFMIHYTGPGLPLVLTAVVMGLGSGSEVTLEAYYVGRYFGLQALGQLYGAIYVSMGFGAIFGGFALNLSFDHTGSYDLGFYVAETLMIIGVAIIGLLGPYRFGSGGARSGHASGTERPVIKPPSVIAP